MEGFDEPAIRITIDDDPNTDLLYVMAVIDGFAGDRVDVWARRRSDLGPVWGPVTVRSTTEDDESFTNIGITRGALFGVDYLACIWTWFRSAKFTGAPGDHFDVACERALVVADTGLATSVEARYTLASRVKPWQENDRFYAGCQTTCTAGMWTEGPTAGSSDPTEGHLGAEWPGSMEKYANVLDAHVVMDLPDQRAGTPGVPGYQLAGVYDVGAAPPVVPSAFDIGNCQTSYNPAFGVWRWAEIESAPRGLEVSEIEQDYTTVPRVEVVTSGTVVIGGAFVAWYDGDRVVELGHVHPPMPYRVRDERSSDNPAVDPVGSIESEHWLAWQAHWVSFDANGALDRSLPTPRFTRLFDTMPTPSAVTDGSVSILFRTIGATNRLNEKQYGVAVYREEFPSDVGSTGVPQRINKRFDATLNEDALTTSKFFDLGAGPFSATSNQGFEPLYTIGGEIEAVCPEGARIPAVVNGRLWLGGFYRRHRVQYSKPFAPGTASEYALAPEFNEGFGFVLGSGSQVTGLAHLDQDAVLFTRDAVYLNAGEGPDDTGAANDFSGPRRISSDSGCIEPRSVVETPDGVMFRSDAGLYLLDRGRSVVFIGEAVQNELDAFPVVTSAVLVPAENHVRFTCVNAEQFASDGIILVFDYTLKQWFKWTPLKGDRQAIVAVSACVHDGVYYIAEASGQLWRLDPSVLVDDDDNAYESIVETAWLQASQHGGWQRVQNVIAMCERRAPINITLEVETDFDAGGGSGQSYTWSDAEVLTFPRLPDMPLKMKLIDQKSYAVRIRLIVDEGDFVLSGFHCEIVTKRGGLKAAAAQRA